MAPRDPAAPFPPRLDEASPPCLLVEVHHLSKRYGKRGAVRGVSLEVARGALYGVIGPDGSGKSSLFKAIAGVLSCEEGQIRVFDRLIDSEQSAESVKDRIGFMPQGLGLNLYPELSVEENIDFFAQLRLVPAQLLAQRKARLLAMTHLERFRTRPMKNLSGGMKQKLGLICTLIHEPELIILDEPTTGVDPVSRRDFWRILAHLLREREMTALVSTAYLDEASRFDRISLMYAGEMLAEGEPEALRAELAATIVTLRAGAREVTRRLEDQFRNVDVHGDRVSVLVPTADAVAALAQARAALPTTGYTELRAEEPQLEDLFVARVRARMDGVAPPALPANAPTGEGAPAKGYAIEAVELTRDFGAFRAVDHVSFQVSRGEIFGLLGANGAGKTTVIKMLTGILPASAGAGHVAGADMRFAGRQIKQRVGYMSQAFSLYTDLSAEENILLYAGIYGLMGRQARERAQWVLELGGLHEHRRDAAGSLPMGLRQRLALGCALVHRPQVLFLDEPTSGVDPLGRRHFWNILFWLAREQNVSILLTTHYMSEAELCDHLVLMYDGRAVADASPAAMKEEVQREAGVLLEIRADPAPAALEALAAAGYGEGVLHGRRVHLLVPRAAFDGPRVAALLRQRGIDVGSVEERALTMEDVFVHRMTQLQRAAAARETAQ